jgi:hypothetical protein
MDHLDGLGHLHRNKQGRRYTGATLYRMLKAATYPPGYSSACATAHAITQAIQKLPPGGITTYDVAGKHITTMYHYDSGKMESMFPRAQDAPWLKMKFPEPDPQGGKNPWSEEVSL